MSRPRNVILDVDTGVDDAMALLLAARHPSLRLLAVTCVAGNTDVDRVVRNTLAVLAVAGADDVPVARGAGRPILEPHRDASHVHGVDGLGGLELRPSLRKPVAAHAVELLRDRILGSDAPVTLVPLGPLTNVALLLRMHPEVQEHIERIVLMGGSAGVGNATPVAEFNIWHDPEAAAIVFGSTVPITMYGLDVFVRVDLGEDDLERLGAADNPGADLVHRFWESAIQRDIVSERRMSIGDAGAVCAVIDPDGLGLRTVPVRVALAGESRGQTVVDLRARPGESDLRGAEWGRPVEVALDVDVERYRRLFLASACGVGS
jgi:pyrimidine-specific ribonucleoside hydrolase